MLDRYPRFLVTLMMRERGLYRRPTVADIQTFMHLQTLLAVQLQCDVSVTRIISSEHN